MSTNGTPPTSSSSDEFHNPAFHDQSLSKDYYLLSSDHEGTTRLALQHFIWRQCLQFDIHPSVPPLPSPSPAVVDVATGTGLWLLDVANSLDPSAKLFGLDINLEQTPPAAWLPANVKMRGWNIYDEVPEEFVGRFDLVHARMITVAIKENQVEPIVRNLCRLLKPGGYLQWDEIDMETACVVKADPGIEVPAMDAWCAWIRERAWMDRWKVGILDVFAKHGLENVERFDFRDRFTGRMDLMKFNNDQLLMLYEQFAKRLYAAGNKASGEFLTILAKASKESQKGAALILPPFTWVARKAL